MEKVLLALDQSSHTTGYAIFKGEKLIQFGHFTLDDADVATRLFRLRNKLVYLTQEYQVDEIAFEDIQLQTNVANNVNTHKVLAEVFGIIHEFCAEYMISYYVVPSVTWKSTLKIKGRARAEQKRNAQLYASTTYNIKPTQDEADAICIGTHILLSQAQSYEWE